jgi:dienelactone hydrolase
MKRGTTLVITLLTICLLPRHLNAAESRADFLKLIDRPRVPLAVQTKDQTPATMPAVMSQAHFSFAADAEQRVPGILIKSKDSTSRRPVVIVLHGTGGTKDGEAALLRTFATKGFIGVAIDGRYHGERTKAGKGSVEYQEAIVKAYHDQKEHPFFYDSVWDVMRTIDYLQTREDVDPARIGLMGISKGGVETYLAAAADTRIAAAVPCIGVQSFQWALENNSWQSRIGTIQSAFDTLAKENGIEKPDSAFVQKFYDRVVPGIHGEFDGPAMVPLIAPRPLMTINGEIDPRTPMPGLKLCIDATQKAYHDAGSDDHFNVMIEKNTGHKVNPDAEAAAVEWFVKWLKP